MKMLFWIKGVEIPASTFAETQNAPVPRTRETFATKALKICSETKSTVKMSALALAAVRCGYVNMIK